MSLDYLISKIKKNNFLLIGRAGIDIYPDPPGTKTENAFKFNAHLGGSSANTAVELTKLGGNCHLLSRVSDDALGRLAINELKKYNASLNANILKITYDKKLTNLREIISILEKNKISYSEINTYESDLEDVFLKLTKSN